MQEKLSGNFLRGKGGLLSLLCQFQFLFVIVMTLMTLELLYLKHTVFFLFISVFGFPIIKICDL